ncbi:hypothetical protein BDN70DRAFT_264346 [Pholiota conissans]|uniref:NYN domain-containing protein n=1 Tax=Pholiota conissans TaxID=109636 RepID=A0A9P5Z973_9AGAR|nr:hypothetical protein BDN70DRAFT_264346 [Pholiota conissans]
MMNQENIAIFWDYGSTQTLSATSSVSVYDIVANIRSACLELGTIKSFRAYGNFTLQGSASMSGSHSELVASGVTVVNCLDDARKEVAVKMMLVDMIAQAWDYPTGHTLVIITGDRGVAYAVGVLRMRRIKVVVISSVTAHPDLTAHATTKLDWTKTILGSTNGMPHSMDPHNSKTTSPKKPSQSSLFAPQSWHNGRTSDTQCHQNPLASPFPPKPVETTPEHDAVELQNMHPRARRHSIFPTCNPRKSEGFGTTGDMPLIPETQQRLYGLGNGPLFPQYEEERHRAESVPPIAFNIPSLSETTFTTSTGKGKACAYSAFEEPAPPSSRFDIPYSGSIFEPFTKTSNSISPILPSQYGAPSMSTSSSSSSSQPSNFSPAKHPDTTDPTSVMSEIIGEPKATVSEHHDKINDATLPITSSATESNPDLILSSTKAEIPCLSVPSRRSSISTINVMAQISQAAVYEPKRASEPVPGIPVQLTKPVAGPSQPTPSTLSNVVPPPRPVLVKPSSSVAPKSVPNSKVPKSKVPISNSSTFQTLITVLRRKQTAIPRSSLNALLIKEDPRVYELAGVKVNKKFKSYIAAAIKAGVVSESNSGDTIALSAEYRRT